MIGTGGTIASKQTENGLAPGLTPNDILACIPQVKHVCGVETLQVCNIDSTNVTPEHWKLMVEAVEKHYDAYDGFVICHGTDTMAYTAAALSYLIQNSPKPIVLTGSQRPLEMEITDASMNLRDSIIYAMDEKSNGVSLVFGGKIIAGTRAKKTRSMSYDAFSSINYPQLAVMRGEHLVRYIPPEHYTEPVRFYHEWNPRVFLLKLTPGIEPAVLEDIFQRYDGIIVESFGTGGIPDSLLDEFSRLMKRYENSRKAVVMTTQVTYEGSNLGIYEVGRRIKDEFQILEAREMNLEAVLTKLMWILGRNPENFNEIRDAFYQRINFDIFI